MVVIVCQGSRIMLNRKGVNVCCVSKGVVKGSLRGKGMREGGGGSGETEWAS